MFHRILVGVDDSPRRQGGARASGRAGGGRPRPPRPAEQRSQAAPPGLAPDPACPPDQPRPARAPAGRVGAGATSRKPRGWCREEIPRHQARRPAARPAAALLREARSGRWDLVVVGEARHSLRWALSARVGDRLNRQQPHARARRPRRPGRRAHAPPASRRAAAPSRLNSAADRHVHQLPVACGRRRVGGRLPGPADRCVGRQGDRRPKRRRRHPGATADQALAGRTGWPAARPWA